MEKLRTEEVKEDSPNAKIYLADDDRSHIVDGFGALRCEEELELMAEVDDVDCPECIDAFNEQEA